MATASNTEAPAPWSLQARLRRRLLAVLCGLWLLAAAGALAIQQYEMREVLDASLEETAEYLAAMPAPGDPALGTAADSDMVLMQLLDAQSGRVLWRSGRAPAQPLSAERRARIFDDSDRRLAVRPSADAQRVAIVAEALAERREALWMSALWMLVPLLALLPIGALCVSWVLRSGFARLEPWRRELAERDPAQLDTVDGNGLPSELAPLAGTVNQLLERVASLMAAERQFAANSAHELRTPLAAARAQAQRLEAELAPGAARERARGLIRQIDHLHHLVVKLLQLSRLDAGSGVAQQPVELNQLASMVAGEFAAAGGRLRLRLTDAPVWARGDVDTLGIGLRNLIENALHHTVACDVELCVGTDARLEVIDAGPGITPALLAELPRPFKRGPALLSGHGLGLSIAATAARQSGGQLHLVSPHRNGRGLAAIIELHAC